MNFDDRPETAKRLEKARIARGFTVAKAAAKFFGWNYETYIQHENGTRGITRAASRYAKAYRVSEGWLLTGEGQGPDVAQQNAETQLRSALLAFGVDSGDLKRIVAIVRGFVDDLDEQSEQSPPDDQPSLASRRREVTPSR